MREEEAVWVRAAGQSLPTCVGAIGVFAGILPELCLGVERATDAHVRFHAISALHFGMLQLRSAYQVPCDDITSRCESTVRGL